MYNSKNFHLYVDAINTYRHARIDPDSLLRHLALEAGAPVTLTVERNPTSPEGYHWHLTWQDPYTGEEHHTEDHRLDAVLWLAEIQQKISADEHAGRTGTADVAELPLFAPRPADEE